MNKQPPSLERLTVSTRHNTSIDRLGAAKEILHKKGRDILRGLTLAMAPSTGIRLPRFGATVCKYLLFVSFQNDQVSAEPAVDIEY